MNYIIHRLIEDDCGMLLSMEMILMATIVLLGSIVGLSAFRDSVVQEFGDLSAGLAELDHGYEYNDINQTGTLDGACYTFSILGSSYIDQPNFCEPAVVDPTNAPPMCMEISAAMVIDEDQRVP